MNINDSQDIFKIINSNAINKIFFITGKNSYFKSGAHKIFENKISKKNIFFYFKKIIFLKLLS